MTRQTDRQLARAHAKRAQHNAKRARRRIAYRDLLERQTRREKAGVYTGRSVGQNAALSRKTPIEKRRIAKGVPYGRILREYTVDGIEIMLHATKGWRRVRI